MHDEVNENMRIIYEKEKETIIIVFQLIEINFSHPSIFFFSPLSLLDDKMSLILHPNPSLCVSHTSSEKDHFLFAGFFPTKTFFFAEFPDYCEVL